jgi:hypothetical protein
LMAGEFGPPGEQSPLTAGASSSISFLLRHRVVGIKPST